MKFAVLLAAAFPIYAQEKPGPEKPVAKCEALRHRGDPDATRCYQALTKSPDPATQAEGLWGLKQYKPAFDLFNKAIDAHPKDADLHIRLGRMLLEHWQPADAAESFGKALEIKPDYAPAVLGLAMVAEDGFEGKAAELAQKALKSDPKLYEAQELLARVALEDNNPQKAAAEAKKALDIYPEALNAMATLATIDWLDDKQSAWMDKALKINPMYGEGYERAAHFFIINRRYDEGIRLYRKAIELKPDLWSAHSQLGINLMRFGKDGEARQELEKSYDAGYKDAPTTNTLKLLDSYKNYKTYETPTTILRLHKKEAELLKPYFESELQRAIATYEKKYKFKLPAPVQVEVYPDHEDFAVRTMGMPGLGALGVTFGEVVAMDSPSARKPGTFHWDSTMWHELSHVYVLTMTKSRVPRWFTEGLAVYEETGNGNPDWGDRLDPEAINAIKQKKLLPVSEIDRGFIHPTYPTQVVVSYFQAGKICNFIDQKWGYGKLLAMIKDFADLIPTPQVIEKEFQMKPEEFDRQFFAWLDEQTKSAVNGFDEWRKQLRDISEKVKAKNWDEVIKEGNAIRDVYADYVETGSVYEFLAEAYIAKGDKPKAIAQLERYSEVGGRNPATLKQLATLQTEAGNKQAAAKALERLNLIYLKDEEAHKKLGDLYLALNNPTGAAREFAAVIAGGTVDQAGAHFELAKAYQAAGKLDDARNEVLAALEVAPGFKPAQKLLLELNPSK